ncbi:MAG TPA: YdeI/OmpD-associated family protein [Polyangiaceae bacterium]|nr:YdeI/OmpD-associated family protein [Polyangiaceae bacterium]
MNRLTEPKGAEPILELSCIGEWAAWLTSNHHRSQGVWLHIPKKGSKKALTYAEALEVALAWGWIDSQKRSFDARAWLQRFSPRKANSPWSKINRTKAEALIAAGTMQAPGLAEVERAKRDGRWQRAYDGARVASVPSDLAAALALNARARAFFETLDSANRYAILYRVQTAKHPDTRVARIERFVEMCARQETIHPPRRAKAGTLAAARSPQTRRTTKVQR